MLHVIAKTCEVVFFSNAARTEDIFYENSTIMCYLHENTLYANLQ